MPFKSEAQRRKLRELAKEGKIKPEVLAGFEKESRGLKLPERSAKPRRSDLQGLSPMDGKKRR